MINQKNKKLRVRQRNLKGVKRINKIIFEGRRFTAIKKGNNYFGIEINGRELTSTTTSSSAIKRVKLMDKVYNMGYSQGNWDNY